MWKIIRSSDDNCPGYFSNNWRIIPVNTAMSMSDHDYSTSQCWTHNHYKPLTYISENPHNHESGVPITMYGLLGDKEENFNHICNLQIKKMQIHLTNIWYKPAQRTIVPVQSSSRTFSWSMPATKSSETKVHGHRKWTAQKEPIPNFKPPNNSTIYPLPICLFLQRPLHIFQRNQNPRVY